MATTETHASLSIGDKIDEARAEAAEPRDREYLQLRRELDIGAFGAYAIRADAGKELVDERSAVGYARDSHEELYVVLSGRATFVVEGEEVDAGPGAKIFVRNVEATRAAIAQEDGTTLLVVGGRRGEAWRPTPGEAMYDFMPLYEAKDYEGALRVSEDVLEEYPGNGLALYNLACMENLLGRSDDALAHLRDALEAAPPLTENARTDEDFASVREDPRFIALVA